MIGLLLRTRMFALIAVALAAGVPYLAMNSELRQQISKGLSNLTAKARSVSSTEDDADAGLVGNPDVDQNSIRNHVNDTDTSLLFTPSANDLRDVFRFDITPNWVKSRWPRVSACVYEDGMDGLRVPLVSGTQRHDIHGSLTFFFDDEHRVQRISFFGYTGDASRLVELVTSQFGFQTKHTYSAGLYINTYHGRPVGALRLLSAAVIRADDPNRQVQVQLEINSPNGTYRMSQRFAQLLEEDRLAGRWR